MAALGWPRQHLMAVAVAVLGLSVVLQARHQMWAVTAALAQHQLFLALALLMLAVAAVVLTPELVEQAVLVAVGMAVQTARLLAQEPLIPAVAVAVWEQAHLPLQAVQAAPASSSSSTPYPYSLS